MPSIAHPLVSALLLLLWQHTFSHGRVQVTRTHNRIQPSIYFASVATEFARPVWYDTPDRNETLYGFHALGTLGDPELDLWNSRWVATGMWFTNQIYVSPLRVHKQEEADIVYVPAIFGDDAACTRFMDTVVTAYPLVQHKPHLLALSYPLANFMSCMSHDLAKLFTYISLESWSEHAEWTRELSLQSIATPYLGHLHWYAGSRKYTSPFETENKAQLVFASWVTRTFPERTILRDQCNQAADHICTFFEYDPSAELKSAKLTIDGYERSYYVAMPRGDFVTRSSLYDVLCTGAVPIVFHANYSLFLPYHDIIDYSKLLLVVDTALDERAPSFLNFVQDYGIQQAKHKMRYLSRVAHLFQYSLNPDHSLVTFPARDLVDSKDDAFTATMKAVLRNLCAREKLVKC